MTLQRSQRYNDFEPLALESKSEDLEKDGSLGGEEDNVGELKDCNSIKYLFRYSTWKKIYCTYDSKPQDFDGTSNSNIFLRCFLMMLQLFEIFGHITFYVKLLKKKIDMPRHGWKYYGWCGMGGIY